MALKPVQRRLLFALHYPRRFGTRTLLEAEATYRGRKHAADILRKWKNRNVSVGVEKMMPKNRYSDSKFIFRKKLHARALERSKGNITHAAKWLGRTRSAMSGKVNEFRLRERIKAYKGTS